MISIDVKPYAWKPIPIAEMKHIIYDAWRRENGSASILNETFEKCEPGASGISIGWYSTRTAATSRDGTKRESIPIVHGNVTLSPGAVGRRRRFVRCFWTTTARGSRRLPTERCNLQVTRCQRPARGNNHAHVTPGTNNGPWRSRITRTRRRIIYTIRPGPPLPAKTRNRPPTRRTDGIDFPDPERDRLFRLTRALDF